MSVLWIGQPDPRPERAAGSSLAADIPYVPVEPLPRRGRHRKAGRVSHRAKGKSRLARIAPIAAVLPVTAFLYATTLPAAASSVMFYVVDNGGVLVTSQPLHPGETIFHAGVAYRVVSTHPLGSHTEFRAIPAVTSSGVFTAHG